MRAFASKVQSDRQLLQKKRACRSARFLADAIAVWMTAGLFFAPMAQAAVAQTAITPNTDKTATKVTVGQGGRLHDITTESVRNQVGLNAFKQFDLAGGDIANLRLPGGAHTLLNFVDQRINIDGTLNALKDNRVGGNVFFISQQGMAVGAGGVINVGSLGVVTPTRE